MIHTTSSFISMVVGTVKKTSLCLTRDVTVIYTHSTLPVGHQDTEVLCL